MAAAAWAVLLLVLAYLSIGRDAPTVREQRSIAEAFPVVQRALGELVVAAGPEAVVELSPVKLDKGCRVTPFRHGATVKQAVVFHTRQGGGSALLDRIARQLPPRYRASARQGRDGSTYVLVADAGGFVAVRGVSRPGAVTLSVSTGCRPAPFELREPLIGRAPPEPDPARLLSALGVQPVGSAQRFSAAGVDTVRAVGRGTPAQPLDDVLRPFAGPGAVVVVDQPDGYAYRDGKLNVVVEAGGAETRVAVTNAC